MAQRNPNLAKLKSGYLFPEINKRKQEFLLKNPQAKLISLGIGDTTEPLSPFISQYLEAYTKGLSTFEGYSGYGAEQGQQPLRQAISEVMYNQQVSADEIFVSDGSKCDIGRLQLMFGANATIAVQNPTYPVYVDSGVALGQTEHYDADAKGYKGIIYMNCVPENDFFPDLSQQPRTDLIYFCSPNNPTGSVATRKQLEELVAFAKRNRSIIIYDAAYSVYIQDADIPRSIYEIEGAREVAIELGSFSKMAGFTGVRLAWSIIPKELHFDDGTPVSKDWHRINTTFFNGASNIAQQGGLAVLREEKLKTVRQMVDFYMHNAAILRTALERKGLEVHGGANAPYLWVRYPNRLSWDIFNELLEHAHLITTPGSGFGEAGEGFLRFSAFGRREHIHEAVLRMR